jgi:hypothetical protein
MKLKHLRPFSFLSLPIAASLLLVGCSQSAPQCDGPLTRAGVESIFLTSVRDSVISLGRGSGLDDLMKKRQLEFQDGLSIDVQRKLHVDPNSDVKKLVLFVLEDIKTSGEPNPGAERSCTANISVRTADDPSQEALKFPAQYDIRRKDDAYTVAFGLTPDLQQAVGRLRKFLMFRSLLGASAVAPNSASQASASH